MIGLKTYFPLINNGEFSPSSTFNNTQQFKTLKGFAPLTISLSGFNRNILAVDSWAWNVSGGYDVDYTSENIVHTFNNDGIYYVKLSGTNVYGTYTQFFVVSAFPVKYHCVVNNYDLVDTSVYYGNYIIVNNTVSNFNVYLKGINGLQVSNVYDLNNFNNCKISFTNTNQITSSQNELFVNNNVTLSASDNNVYTFYYFNTGYGGSPILGISEQSFSLSAIKNFPICPTQTPTPSITPTYTPTPSITPTKTQTPTVTRTPTKTPKPTQTPTITRSPSNTPTKTATPTITPSISPTRTPLESRCPTPTPTPTNTPTNTPTLLQTSTLIWTGLGSDNNWSTSSNWNIRVPKPFDELQFGFNRLTPFNNLTIDAPYNGIKFNTGAAAFALSGNRFTLNFGNIENNSSNTQTINNDIILASSAGNVDCKTADINLNGKISGSGSLTKIGTQALSLSGNNTYTGNTFINAGTINVFNSNPFGTGSVYLSSATVPTNGFINIPSTATPANTIINNPIYINGAAGTSLIANKSVTLNGLIVCGPIDNSASNITQTLRVNAGNTITINGGVSGYSNWTGEFNTFGASTHGLFIINSPIILNNAFNTFTINSPTPSTVTFNVSGHRFYAFRLMDGMAIMNTSFVINNEMLRIGNDTAPNNLKIPLLNLNGTDQILRNINNNSTNFASCTSANIFNNSSTFSNLTANNVTTFGYPTNTTYTGNISGNINLIKTGTGTLTLSGSTSLGIGPRYTGFTAISAGTLVNYGLSSNPSNKVNFASFTNTTLTVDFTTPPIVGDSFILLPARTVNLYPAVTLQNASGRTGSYNSANSTLTIT